MSPPEVTQKTVLVVEDNDAAREGIAFLLQDAGYQVAAVENGKQALEYLSENRPPALILLDMLMPVLDGWRFMEELQQHSRPLAVPIIITTGTILTPEWAAAHGCAGFLRKPIEREALLREVERCLP